ncbi:ABC transporter substrate-binding protein [Humitalea sp. 24SJ18S-53]|uniref:ABC transporter substrate-binding protein n=1 Tax=Humitalea sp. 24SJ18S-53 TaxID=3422307 RepID=UPI003D66A0AF
MSRIDTLPRRGLLGGAAALVAGSARAQAPGMTIAVYAGSSSAMWRDQVAAPFSAQSGIRTEIFESALPASSIAQSRGRPQFDAAVVANYSAPGLAERNLLEELTVEDIPAIRQVPEQYWTRNAAGKIIGMPVYFSFYGIAYNSELVRAADFASWNDLLDPKWKGKLSMSRASFVAAYDLTLYSKLAGGTDANIDPGIPSIRRLASNVLSVYTSMSSLQSQLSRGEVVAAPFYSTQVGMMKRSGVRNVDIVIPREGAMNLSYMLVIPKGARNMASAKRLLNSILEPAYQTAFAQEALSFPMNPTVDLPADVQAVLGGTTQEMMARNYSPDWWVVGSALPQRTRMIEELLQSSR